ncbi:MAG: S8 family serine peptidase [Myxococcales bacterium]
MMILDGGFAPSADFPDARSVAGDWNAPSLLACAGGAACPWHGTMVTTCAMGKPDDSFGAAGPAGPVGELLAVPFQSDFFGIISTLERIVGSTVFGNPRIINMSFGFEVDLGWDIAVKASCLGLCPSPTEVLGSMTAVVAASGKLLFAAAGNAGKDVDNGADVVEGSTFVPCELPGVICVGGMGHGVTARDPASNFGSKAGDATVDIYGPFWMWVGPDPDNAGNVARLVSGTSFSSPFVAGVAALVWAANPGLSAGQVWETLRDTAHVGGVGVGGNDRRVDAFAAVARILGGAPPSVTLNGAATAALNREWSGTSVVNDPEYSAAGFCPPSACPLSWSPVPARTSGNVATYRFTTVGTQAVSVTAQDLVGQETSATRSVVVVNSPPVVAISQPAAGASIPQGVPTQLLGSATDLNEGADPGPGAIACRWVSSAADPGFPSSSCNTSVTFGSTGPRTLTLSATDPQGVTSSANVAITVTPPPANLPPTITLGALPPPNYSGGYDWEVPIAVTASATDPEGNTPISYTWKATSLRPQSETVFASEVVIAGPSASASLNWTPSATPSLLGDFAALGNDCYYGQVVRLTLHATDSLGNRSTRSVADIKIFRCILI